MRSGWSERNSTANNDGQVNGNYGGQRILEIAEKMIRPRRIRRKDDGTAVKRKSVSDDLNRDPVLGEYDKEAILPSKGVIVRKSDFKGSLVTKWNGKDPGHITVRDFVPSSVAKTDVTDDMEGTIDIESHPIVTNRRSNRISDGDTVRNSKDDHCYHEADVEVNNGEVFNNGDIVLDRIPSKRDRWCMEGWVMKEARGGHLNVVPRKKRTFNQLEL